MKARIDIILVLLALALLDSQPCSGSQSTAGEPGEPVQRLDSVIGIIKDLQTGSEVTDYVFIYKYQPKKTVPYEVVKLDLPQRAALNRQLYTYSFDGFRTRYLYQEWTGSTWQDKMQTEYFPDINNKLSQEVFSGPGAPGEWLPYQQHFYQYDPLGRIALYRRQMRNDTQGWYDFSENVWNYNGKNQLVTRFEKRTADDLVIWTETYYYGDGIKPVERIKQAMKYDPVLKQNRLMNDTRQLYFYDEFNDPDIMEQYRWINNEWVLTGRSMYYYSFFPGRRVTLCFNGETITVPPQAVNSYLERGAVPGPCVDSGDGAIVTPGLKNDVVNKSARVFPNPASDYFEVVLQPDHNFKTAMLFAFDGRVVRSEDVMDAGRVMFTVSGLKSGQYILRLSGASYTEDIQVVIK